MSSISVHVLISTLLRLFLIFYSLIHDQIFQVKYTDVDYSVFTDGAKFVAGGRSPYLRDGYRYSPVFAFLLVPNVVLFNIFGKLLFVAFDVFTGWCIYRILRVCHIRKGDACIYAAIWLYNPLPLVVSTRGSSDSIVTSLMLLSILMIIQDRTAMAGLLLGTVCHVKIFPVVFFPALYMYLRRSETRAWSFETWSPFNRKRIEFLFWSIVSFALLTGISYHWYGQRYLHEAWIYHVTRKDTQHNFSVYFYLYKLVPVEYHQVLSGLAFIPQIVTVLWSTGQVIRSNSSNVLFLVLFTQTFLFVHLNKVITSQYFLWYLCLFPLVVPWLKIQTKVYFRMFAYWFSCQVVWLIPAYLFEFQHMESCFFWTWISSVIFLVVNIFIMLKIGKSFMQEVKSE